MLAAHPPVKDLVLVGGGHAHVQVLKAFAMRPLGGLRITLISRELDTPYSGMLPGALGGLYRNSDVHIPLPRLARYAGARLLTAEVGGVDPIKQRVRFGERSLHYDLLSINSGAAPVCPFETTMDAPLPVLPVKPIGRFLPGFDALRERLTQTDKPLVIVGGGAGGFEVALAVRSALGAALPVTLVAGGRLLNGHGARVQQLARTALAEAQVRLLENRRVREIDDKGIALDDGGRFEAAAVLWVTGVGAPRWLDDTGLERDGQGFLAVDEALRVGGRPNVFAAGDVAGMIEQPRPKSGVFAVRQGGVLAANLRATLLKGRLRRYRAQGRYLALLNCADGTAIASYAGIGFRHRGLMLWKDWIDRRFMRRFTALPPMASSQQPAAIVSAEEMPGGAQGDTFDMRCGGCGSKLGASLLERVLRDLPVARSEAVRTGIGDDAAVLSPGAGDLVLTTDGFRTMVDDPWLLGRVAVHHALSDVYAMGATPTAVLVNATIPYMAERMVEDELRQLLGGVVSALAETEADLVGGHSAEGAELSIGISVLGQLAAAEGELPKRGARAGEALILTKALGTGTLLAGMMRGEIDSPSYAACLASLDVSNAAASRIVRAAGASACTDVTGFGLAGHLLEMLGDELGASLDLRAIPALPGARAALASGVRSTLHDANTVALQRFLIEDDEDPRAALLADPQTVGGLLATVPAAAAEHCLEALHAAGYPDAAQIGVVTTGGLLARLDPAFDAAGSAAAELDDQPCA